MEFTQTEDSRSLYEYCSLYIPICNQLAQAFPHNLLSVTILEYLWSEITNVVIGLVNLEYGIFFVL